MTVMATERKWCPTCLAEMDLMGVEVTDLRGVVQGEIPFLWMCPGCAHADRVPDSERWSRWPKDAT